MKYLPKTDPEIAKLIKSEDKRQETTLMMIPSENVVSYAVEEAVGSSFGNKYAEGYPGKRYYQGQQNADQLETLVIERVKKLFKVAHANVQAHSGSPANFAVFTALLKPGSKIMGMSLNSGGHLTHGARLNASSVYFNAVNYDVKPDGYIDYDALKRLAKKTKPDLIIAGTTAYARLLDWKKFADIADSVGAFLMADMSHISGLVATGVYPSPVPFVHVVTTTTHKTLRGPRGALIMVTPKGVKKDPDMGTKIDKAIIPGIQGGPHLNAIAGIGVALKEAGSKKFKSYSKQIVKNAKTLEKTLLKHGFTLVTGGTDSHLLLIDCRNKNLLGNTVALGCEVAGIVLNYNAVPFDPNPPFSPSGIRLGTPGITSRGMKEPQMVVIANFIDEVVTALQKSKARLKVADEQAASGEPRLDMTEREKKRTVRTELVAKTPELKQILKKVEALCKKFPLTKVYPV